MAQQSLRIASFNNEWLQPNEEYTYQGPIPISVNVGKGQFSEDFINFYNLSTSTVTIVAPNNDVTFKTAAGDATSIAVPPNSFCHLLYGNLYSTRHVFAFIAASSGGGGGTGQDVTAGNTAGVVYISGSPTQNGSLRWEIENGTGGQMSAALQQLSNGAWTDLISSSVNGTSIAKSITTGPGSFYLSNMHSISSGAQNVFFKNLDTGIDWFPAWQSSTYDGTNLNETPLTTRMHNALQTLEINGAVQAGSIQQGSVNLWNGNFSVFELTVIPSEYYSGEISYNLYDTNKQGRFLYSQSMTVSTTAGVPLNLILSPGIDLSSGFTTYGEIVKADGTLLNVRPGTPNTLPYAKVVGASYQDVLVISVANVQTAFPKATTSQIGAVSVDGVTIAVDSSGKISATAKAANYQVVANQAARVALPGSNNLTICLQQDIQELFYLNANLDPTVLTNWIDGGSTATTVLSFNARTGNVLPVVGDYRAYIASWAQSSAYKAGETVVYPVDGNVYVANTTIASGTAWNPSNWNQLIPFASTSVAGLVKLAGDLGGSSSSPTVQKIQGVAISGVPAAGQILTASGPTSAGWSTMAATPDATTTSKGVVQLAGDFGGAAASPTVQKIQGVAISGTPSAGQVLIASAANAAAWGTSPATADATATSKGVVQLAGDIGGTAASPSVAKVGQATVPGAAPTSAGMFYRTSSTSASAWSAIQQADVPAFAGATSGAAGSLGGVPAPAAGRQDGRLMGDASYDLTDRLAVVSLSNFTAAGSIGTAAATVDIAGCIIIPQTTAGNLLLTLPAPTAGTKVRNLKVLNSGTQSFQVQNVGIPANSFREFSWNSQSSVWQPASGSNLVRLKYINANSGASGNAVAWTNNVYDNSTAFVPSTGIFTAPRAGYYRVTFSALGNVTLTGTGQRFGVYPSLNGSSFQNGYPIASLFCWGGAGTYTNVFISGTWTFNLKAGDTIRLILLADAAQSCSITANSNFDQICIEELPLVG
jgi:hypothetical protein